MRRLFAIALATTACAAPQVTAPVVPRGEPTPAVVEPEATCVRGDERAALPSTALESSQALVARLGTGADPYWLQDGVWLASTPVLLNEDFDFGTAMGLGAVGAGLAAKTRQDHNAARAAERAGEKLDDDAQRALDALRACGEHRYLIDWGGANPVLRVVSDLFDATGKRIDTTVREVTSRDGWWNDAPAAAP